MRPHFSSGHCLLPFPFMLVNGADGISDIEGKAVTGSGEQAGTRASFNLSRWSKRAQKHLRVCAVHLVRKRIFNITSYLFLLPSYLLLISAERNGPRSLRNEPLGFSRNITLSERGTRDPAFCFPVPVSLNQSQRAHSRLIHNTCGFQTIVLLVSG